MILQMWVQECTHMMGYGQFYTHKWDGEWSAGWHLMQVGPKRTLVIMQGTGEGLCSLGREPLVLEQWGGKRMKGWV